MTLEDLKAVLDNALEAAYERKRKLQSDYDYPPTMAQLSQNIALLQDLHLGVVKTIQAQQDAKRQ